MNDNFDLNLTEDFTYIPPSLTPLLIDASRNLLLANCDIDNGAYSRALDRIDAVVTRLKFAQNAMKTEVEMGAAHVI